MKRLALAFLAAALLHVVILLFGGIFFLRPEEETSRLSVEDVDVLDASAEKKEEPQEQEQQPREEVTAPEEQPPAMLEAFEPERADSVLADTTPELSALSLAALESVLSGEGSGGEDFGATGGSLASGGRIGGTGDGDGVDGSRNEWEFGLADLDQTARPLFRAEPVYPAVLRKRKLEGVVTVRFVVDPEGKVRDPQVERATDPAFEAPALEAVRRWKFEPAVRDGKKVASKLRVPIRFSMQS